MSDDDTYPPGDQPAPTAGADSRERYRTDAEGRTRDAVLDRAVVLRRVPSVEADGLQAEARFLARLHAPGLPCVLDFVRDETGAALVLPEMNGTSLAAAIAARAAGQRISAIADVRASVLSFIAVCEALQAAHERGVVHGALSPETIIIGDDGHPAIEGWRTAMQAVDRPLTRRYCAGAMQPPPIADERHQDLRQIGACLHAALVGTMPAVEAPPSDPRIPRALLAVIRRALKTSASAGYRSAADLRADLVDVLAATVAAEGSDHGRRSLAVAVLLLLAGGIIAAVLWRPRGTVTWGSPVAEVDFSTAGWKQAWGALGRWEQRDGRLVSAGEGPCALYLKRRLTPPVAIEYTGRFEADRPGDLSVWWCHDDPAALRPDDDVDRTDSWWVQAGAYQNSWCCVWQTPAQLRQQLDRRTLAPGRDHRFRVEIESNRLRLWIDGEAVFDHHELLPFGDGTIALYTFDPGKAFDDVRVWERPLPGQVSAMAIGDDALRTGRTADAARAYGRVAADHPGTALGEDALFFQGLALYHRGERERARSLWLQLPDGLLQWRAESLHIDTLLAAGNVDTAAERFAGLWRAHPDLRPDLRQRWQANGHVLRDAVPRRFRDIDRWLALRDATLADDPASAWLATQLLNATLRWEEIVSRFPDEHRAVIKALLALGRNQEVIETPWALPDERTMARLNLGDVEGLLASGQIRSVTRADLLCKAGRAAEALPLDPCLAQLYLGGIDGLLARRETGHRTADMLLALGRYEEATTIDDPLQIWAVRTAHAHLGRLSVGGEPAEAPTLLHLLASLDAGQMEQAREQRQNLRINANRLVSSPWFGQIAGLGLIDETLGTAGALRQALVRGASLDGWGGRCALICAAALDPSRDEAVRTMPWRTEAEAWLLLSAALRAELAEDRTAALAAWRAFVALPPTARLLEGHRPSVEIQALAAWRIAAHSRTPPTP